MLNFRYSFNYKLGSEPIWMNFFLHNLSWVSAPAHSLGDDVQAPGLKVILMKNNNLSSHIAVPNYKQDIINMNIY